MEQRFTVKGRLDGLNEYTGACRAGRFAGAGMKRRNQDAVVDAIKAADLIPMDAPVHVRFIWYDKANRSHRHRDKDNIAFAKKFILDGMVEAGLIPDDDWSSVYSFHDFFSDWHEDMVEVIVEEIEED